MKKLTGFSSGRRLCILLCSLIALAACKKGDSGPGTGPSTPPPADPPVISSISPDNGPWSTVVTITGSGFSTNLPDNVVKINDSIATLSSATASRLVVAVPKRAGTGAVSVSVKGVKATGPVFNYAYLTNVSTLAGSGNSGYADGTGAAAAFSYLYFVCGDAQGNLYLADQSNYKIRKVTPAGVVSTLAGSTRDFADGNGTAAKFFDPTGVCLDTQGNLYIADQGNHKIRKITPAGVVSTFAGSTPGVADGNATTAQFQTPTGICIDAQNNLYVTEVSSNRIRKITPAGVVSTLAGGDKSGFADGSGANAQFSYPQGICSDSLGNIYVADMNNNRIRKITPAGVVSTLAGSSMGFADGNGVAAQFNGPIGICPDGKGNFYVTDYSNSKIRKITADGVVSTFAGSGEGFADGSPATAKFHWPVGIWLDVQGNMYITDEQNYRIRKITIE